MPLNNHYTFRDPDAKRAAESAISAATSTDRKAYLQAEIRLLEIHALAPASAAAFERIGRRLYELRQELRAHA